jgi:hypothetical protein
MQCNNWPIVIDGKRLFVDRTFGGEPAVYVVKGPADAGRTLRVVHIGGGSPMDLQDLLAGSVDGQVLVVARLETDATKPEG